MGVSVILQILIKCSVGLCQGKGLLMLCLFRGDSKNKKLFFILVEVEKDFHRVQREVICFALRWRGTPEYSVGRVISLYKVLKLMPQLMGNYEVHFL